MHGIFFVFGISTFVKDEQPQPQKNPIFVTLGGIVKWV